MYITSVDIDKEVDEYLGQTEGQTMHQIQYVS